MQWDKHQSGTGQWIEAGEQDVAIEFLILSQIVVTFFSRPLPAVPFWFFPAKLRRCLLAASGFRISPIKLGMNVENTKDQSGV